MWQTYRAIFEGWLQPIRLHMGPPVWFLQMGQAPSRAATEYKCPLPVPGPCGVVTISMQVIGEVILIYAGVTSFTADR